MGGFATGGKSHKPSPAIQAAIDAVREQAWGIRPAANGAAGLIKAKTAPSRDLQHATSIGARSLPAGMLAGALEHGKHHGRKQGSVELCMGKHCGVSYRHGTSSSPF